MKAIFCFPMENASIWNANKHEMSLASHISNEIVAWKLFSFLTNRRSSFSLSVVSQRQRASTSSRLGLSISLPALPEKREQRKWSCKCVVNSSPGASVQQRFNCCINDLTFGEVPAKFWGDYVKASAFLWARSKRKATTSSRSLKLHTLIDVASTNYIILDDITFANQ